MKRRTVLGGLVLTVAAVVLMACGSSSGTPTAPAEGSQALPPVMIEIGGEGVVGTVPATIKVGDVVVFTGESKDWVVETSTADLVAVEQGGTKDTYETNPGFRALNAGAAVVTITSPMGTVVTLDITIE
ncbi:MAG: hypothetical protein RLZZ297_316 [Chloroflexota bacterium]|jgi:hypothetical protein